MTVMGRKTEDVADAELAVLEVLWEGGRATIRQLTEALYPEGTDAQYSTVQKLLERLEAKGCVARNRSARPQVFLATISREELLTRRLWGAADRLCGGSLIPMLTTLVRAQPLDDRDLRELRAMMAELEERSGGGRHGRDQGERA
jgi:BlaI family transcriptional regulator, penicillinase repressor